MERDETEQKSCKNDPFYSSSTMKRRHHHDHKQAKGTKITIQVMITSLFDRSGSKIKPAIQQHEVKKDETHSKQSKNVPYIQP